MNLLTAPAYLLGRIVGWYLQRSLDTFTDAAFGPADHETPTYPTTR